MRAYPNPQLETKRLEIFQKMIESTQALLQKQMEIRGTGLGQPTVNQESEQGGKGGEKHLSNETVNTDGSPQTKSRRRRKRSTQNNKTTPTVEPQPEPAKPDEIEHDKMPAITEEDPQLVPNSITDLSEEN